MLRRPTRSRSTAIHWRSASVRGFFSSTSRAASSPRTRTRKAGRRSSIISPSTIPTRRGSSASAGSTSTPKACCCSPTTAAWRACSNYPRPAGCAAIASAPMAKPISAARYAEGGRDARGHPLCRDRGHARRVQGANAWLTMALREGKNREIKRVLEHLGLTVNRLIRLSFGPFQLGDPAGTAAWKKSAAACCAINWARRCCANRAPTSTRRSPTEAEPEVEEHRPPRKRPPAPAGRKMRTHRAGAEPEPDKPRHRPLPGPRKHVSALRTQERTEDRAPRQPHRTCDDRGS